MKSKKTYKKIIANIDDVFFTEERFAAYENSIDEYYFIKDSFTQDMYYEMGLRDEKYGHYSEHRWYEHLLKVSYIVNGKTYKKNIKLVTDNQNIKDKHIVILYEKNNPYNVISSSLKSSHKPICTIIGSLIFIALLFCLIRYAIFS